MNKEQAVKYLSFSGFSDEQIKAIEGAFNCDKCVYSTSEGCQYDDITETIPPFDDLIQRQAVLKIIDGWYDNNRDTENIEDLIVLITYMGSVNPQKPICPSAGVDCEDCPACEDTISRKAVLDTLERMDKALDEDRTVENYKELLRECYKVLPKKSEWEHDHEILKAYSDGASAVLDKVRAEIDGLLNDEDNSMYAHGVMDCLEIIDKFMAEGSEKE